MTKQAEDLSLDSNPRSGVHLKLPVRIEVDAYAGDDEITLRAIPMPLFLSRGQLAAICAACVMVGAFVATIVGWAR